MFPNFLILSNQLTNWLETNLAFFDIANSQFHYQMTGVTDEADFQLKIKSELLFSSIFWLNTDSAEVARMNQCFTVAILSDKKQDIKLIPIKYLALIYQRGMSSTKSTKLNEYAFRLDAVLDKVQLTAMQKFEVKCYEAVFRDDSNQNIEHQFERSNLVLHLTDPSQTIVNIYEATHMVLYLSLLGKAKIKAKLRIVFSKYLRIVLFYALQESILDILAEILLCCAILEEYPPLFAKGLTKVTEFFEQVLAENQDLHNFVHHYHTILVLRMLVKKLNESEGS